MKSQILDRLAKEEAQKGKVRKFYCGVPDICMFKEHFVNNRCFAPYCVRQTCRYIVRKDQKTWAGGSKETEVHVK